jgi:hypothetical protein
MRLLDLFEGGERTHFFPVVEYDETKTKSVPSWRRLALHGVGIMK